VVLGRLAVRALPRRPLRLGIVDLVSRKWIATIPGPEATGTQVRVLFTKALEAEDLLSDGLAERLAELDDADECNGSTLDYNFCRRWTAAFGQYLPPLRVPGPYSTGGTFPRIHLSRTQEDRISPAGHLFVALPAGSAVAYRCIGSEV
jgi:hypothetical protein